jgi:SAM-dependent methyltransferase
MMDARERVLGLINAAWTTQAIGVACELGLPDRLASGPKSVLDLSRGTATDAAALERLLRALATLELVTESADGTFALAPAAEVLRVDRDGSLAAWARLSHRRLWANWSELGESVRTGRSARSRRERADDFSFLDADASSAEAFNAAMVALTRPVARAAASSLDWKEARVVVDVGGGTGELAVGVLGGHPHLRGVVFDLDHAAPSARRLFGDAGVADRCEFVGGSFFDAVPAGDALLLKSVLHNWDDEDALRILERCAAALNPGGRVILFERVVPERLGSSPHDRDCARSDLNMLVGCGGCERTEARFRSLLQSAGLELAAPRPLVAGFHALEARRA